MKSLLIIGFLFFVSSHQTKKCLVSDEKTAIKIAEAIWKPLYGKKINQSKPFYARMQGDSLWIVCGNMKRKGGPYIEINCSDAKVLRVEYGK